MGFSVDDVKELIKLLDTTEIVDFQLELETGARLIIRKAGARIVDPTGTGLQPESSESRAATISSPEARGISGVGQTLLATAGTEGIAGRPGTGTATSARGESRSADEPGGGTKLIEVTAPMVGTFYRAPSPGAEPFVSVGDRIEVGQTLCIIEAMKLMNEIQAEVSGRVVAVTAEDGQPVEYGQTLFLVEPD